MDTPQAVRFNYSVRHFLIDHGAYNDADSAEFTKYVSNLLVEFWKANDGLTIDGPEQGLELFKYWFLHRPIESVEVIQMSKVIVQITKHYGAVSVTFGLEKDCEISKGSDFFENRAKLQALVEHEFREYEANSLPKQRPGQPAPLLSGESSAFVEIVLDKISIKIENGKRMFSAHGGKYSKFGVPVYPEAMKQFGFDVEQFPIEGMTFENARMNVEMSGDKPKRVVSVSIPDVGY